MFTINPKKIKTQNTVRLRKQGIEVIDHLPWIELKIQRSDTEIAQRCVVLAALLQLYFEAPAEFIGKYLSDNHLLHCLTKQESQLLETGYELLIEQEKINLYWTIEAIWALAWVGGKHNTLTFNTCVEDTLVGMLPDFENNEPAQKFIDSFSVRKQKKVFTMLDKFYRAHWFARNNELKRWDSPMVDLSIIMERRKALEWVSDDNLNWDDIPLDT